MAKRNTQIDDDDISLEDKEFELQMMKKQRKF